MIKPDTNYALMCQDEQILNIVISYITHINIQVNILPLKSMFNKHLIISNTETPSNKKVIISTQERDSSLFINLNLNDLYIDLLLTIYSLTLEPNLIRAIKQKARFNQPNVILNLILRLANHPVPTIDTINILLDDMQSYSLLEYYQCLISFITNTTESNLLTLIDAFKYDYNKLCYLNGTLNNEPPAWILTKYSTQLNSHKFRRNLLKVSLIMLKAKSMQEFSLICLRECIY